MVDVADVVLRVGDGDIALYVGDGDNIMALHVCDVSLQVITRKNIIISTYQSDDALTSRYSGTLHKNVISTLYVLGPEFALVD